jgi:hypothetical protein
MNEAELNLALLRRFEPVLRYTRGERFFPTDVDRYISQCSLWLKRPNQPPIELVPQGALTMDDLTRYREAESGSIFFLKFVEPLDLIELAKYSINRAVKKLTEHPSNQLFHAGRGRLSRVGYGSRFVDALFSLTLIWRGRVPGDTAAAAAQIYNRMQQASPRYCYYGRVLRQDGWIILQYWYFYPFNNWRSGFFGVNDHEGDWEMVTIYCSNPQTDESENHLDNESLLERFQPSWVAYASHDFSGDDLRRRWDDPEVEKVGTHPVVFVGAGSHASYFQRGEYMAELELPFLSPLVKVVDTLQRIWTNFLRQAGSKENNAKFNVFRIPFVDYARGDGVSIGPQTPQEWEAIPLDEKTSWAMEYRGLWGLYAEDPIAGENAPAGPVFNRDGSFRRCWVDPLGWAGLDKVPPDHLVPRLVEEQAARLQMQIAEVEESIRTRSLELQRLGVQGQAMAESCYLGEEYGKHQKTVNALSTEMANLKLYLAELLDIRQAVLRYGQKVQAGYRGALRAHIHRSHAPLPETTEMNVIAEFFAAASVGILLIGFVAIWLFARHYFLIGLASLISALIFLEAGFRRQLPQLINSMAIGLAVVSGFIIIFQFFWQIVIGAVFLAGLFIFWENLMELRR